jgi:hypothetical protein
VETQVSGATPECAHLPRLVKPSDELLLVETLPGFLNHYFRDWYASGAASRLPFRYNAQRTMYWMTHEKNPGYWDAIKPLKVKAWHCLLFAQCMRLLNLDIFTGAAFLLLT